MTGPPDPHPDGPHSPSLDYARELVGRGPRDPGPDGLRQQVTARARSGLLRLLRIQLAHQHAIDVALVDAVTHVRDRLREHEDRLRHNELVGAERDRHERSQLAEIAGVSKKLQAELYTTPYMARAPFSEFDSPVGAVTGFTSSAAFPTAPSPYVGFEDLFRGPPQLLRDLLRPYLPLVTEHAPVFDIGCGAGEFLDLLAANDIAARGVDSDPGMVGLCRQRGLSVETNDLISALEAEPDGRLGTIFSAQVIEHLPAVILWRLLELARAKLRPGGQFIAETVNPHSVPAMKMFWVDPTHQHPIFPEVILAMCGVSGFAPAYVFAAGYPSFEAARFTASRYAVVATHPESSMGGAQDG